MDKIKTRKEINDDDKWNLELVYENIESFNKDLEEAKKGLDKLMELENNFLKSSENLAEYLKQDEKVSRLLEKLSIYANCKSDEDKANATFQELSGLVTNMFTEYNEKTASVTQKILRTDFKIIEKYLEDDEYLKPYKYTFKRIFAKKEHTLSEDVEKTLSAFMPVLTASSDTASLLTNADLEFGKIKDENNKSVELTEANYSKFIKSTNASVRKSAFKKLYKAYAGIKNTLTSTYAGVVNCDAISSRLRSYNSSIEMYLKPNNIPVELYNNLIKVVRENLPVLYEYYELKKDILKLDEFHIYDTYLKVTKDNEKKYSFKEAQELVISALSILGDDYKKVLETAFSNRWIDKYPNKGKRSGAYSSGVYDTNPYVLLNYTETYNDVSTLAHELGHSMHSYYTVKKNPYITADYPIFLAEIASTTNELLLSHYMYRNAKTKDEKLTILNEKLDLFKATIFRQTMFAEFEKITHEYVDNNNILTSEYLCDIYYKLNQDYFGESVIIDDEIKYEWLRIPHFYRPFYVYQYSTSLSIACFITENIISNKEGFKDKYLEFLSSGGKDYPLEVLKIIGIDLHDTKIFESAINTFKETLSDFKKIYYEEK